MNNSKDQALSYSALKSRDFVSSAFIQAFPHLFSHAEIISYFRLTSKGLFVCEALLEKTLAQYRKWRKEATGSDTEVSDEKARRKLIGEEIPVLYYLLDGKKCLPGYLLHVSCNDTEKTNVPTYQANLMDTSDYVHPRDPLLSTIPNLKTSMNSHEGLLFHINFPRLKKQWTFSPQTLSQFATCARKNKSLLTYYKKLNGALREAIKPLQEIIERAKPIAKRDTLFLPSEYTKQQDIKLLTAKGIIFVIEGEDKIKSCFAVYANALVELVRSEIKLFKERRFRTKTLLLMTTKSRVPHVAILLTPKVKYLLSLKALIEFIKIAPKSMPISKQLPRKFTLKDCLKLFDSLFAKSIPIEGLKSHMLHSIAQDPTASFRKIGALVFVLNDKTYIKSCFELKRGVKPKRPMGNLSR